jgi:hypothetical protein
MAFLSCRAGTGLSGMYDLLRPEGTPFPGPSSPCVLMRPVRSFFGPRDSEGQPHAKYFLDATVANDGVIAPLAGLDEVLPPAVMAGATKLDCAGSGSCLGQWIRLGAQWALQKSIIV